MHISTTACRRCLLADMADRNGAYGMRTKPWKNCILKHMQPPALLWPQVELA